MSGIFGVLRRDGAPLGSAAPTSMRRALTSWGADGFGQWSDDVALLGQARTFSTPEARHEALPAEDREAGFAFTAAARLDNREELLRELGLPPGPEGHARLGDGELLQAAYRRWGEATPEHVLGDWSFAAWHPEQRRMVLARDHYGTGTLYYYADASVLAFACSPQAVLALGLCRPVLDELYLAQYLVSWNAYQGEGTMGTAIKRLPPAHALTASPERLDVRCYWEMRDVVEQRLPRREDYAEGLREHLDRAVRDRLRASGPIGISLSGGLDSGSVAVTAAAALREQGQRLHAFTAVPLADPARYLRARVGDELPLAQATAAAAGNIDLVALDARSSSPIAAIRWSLETFGQPIHAAGNQFWIADMLRSAHERGCRVLLTGQQGNGGLSWNGSPLSQPISYRLRRLGARGLARGWLGRSLPPAVMTTRARRTLDPLWYRSSAIHPDLVRRLDLAERRLQAPDRLPRSPLQERMRTLMPGRSLAGAVWAACGAHSGLDVRDPTADMRLITFALSIPDRVFIDAGTGTDRWPIREAMRGRVPDQVRLATSRGRQAADLVPRLRACAGEVDAALEELSDGPAAAYLDMPYMRQVWTRIQREDSPEAFAKAVTVLTRGVMAGLHVNSLARMGHNR